MDLYRAIKTRSKPMSVSHSANQPGKLEVYLRDVLVKGEKGKTGEMVQ